MIFRLLILFPIIFYSFNLSATNIRVVNLQEIINNNKIIESLIIKIENDQKNYLEKFKDTELLLQSELKRINELKLILNENQLQKEIINYNENLNKFNNEVNTFNSFYESQVKDLKDKIFSIITNILKKYSLDNDVDLILDSNNYILSSNSINISELVINELNKENIEVNFEKFK